nr:NTP transferase domain-containing protein [Chloroflexota bacterium]
MKALILAGGLGTRLQSVVSDRPKPMAEVKGKPFLEYQIEGIRSQGFTEIVLCIGYRAEQIQAYFGDGQRWGVHIAYAVERELLGTAGAIRNAAPLLAGTFLVCNGDSYLEADLRALVAFHEQRCSSDPRTLGSIATVAVDNAAAYGTLDLDEAGRILSFREKSGAGASWVNGGVYVLEPNILTLIPPSRPVSLERETFPLALASSWHLYGYPVQGFFVDIGTPEGYERFRRYVEEKSENSHDHP